jgi:sugar fermentation stimulation protein A
MRKSESDGGPLPQSGLYLLFLSASRSRTITVGALGELRFTRGIYIYAGSARRTLPKRVTRHFTTEKPLRWHIDYLTQQAPAFSALALSTPAVTECQLARFVASLPDCVESIKDFGCSDCRCGSHLFRLRSTKTAAVETTRALLEDRLRIAPATTAILTPDILEIEHTR